MKNNIADRILVIGAGLSGATIARELANNHFKVTLIEKRNHIAGNCFDFVNDHGIRVHAYGPHIFHTSNQKVVDWLSCFTEWVPYSHKVKAMLDSGDLVPFPVNAETKKILGETNMVDIFYRPYTKKMWGVEIEDLDPNILSRVPMRLDNSDLYFPNETFQALPKNGYTAMVANIIDHPNIKILVNTSYEHHMEREFLHTFNSMPIDEFFGYEFGQLPYRSIKFHNVNLPLPRVFPVSTVNFTNNGPFTRVTEWKNFPNHGHNSLLTSLTFEEPCSFEDNNFERYYPVKDFQGINKNLFDKYLSMKKNNMTFIGRCGLYLYLDMHQAISSSISIVSKFLQQLSIDNQKGIIT